MRLVGIWHSAWVCSLVLLFSAHTLAAGVLILRGPNAAPYREALNGFHQAFPQGAQIDASNRREFLNRIQSERPELIVAIGREAAETAHERSPEVPLLYLMVPNPGNSGLAGTNVGGISMDLPGDVQLAHFRELLPNRKTFAIIHDPSRVATTIDQAQKSASSLHLDLELVPVNSPDEVRQRFGLVKPIVDAVWVVPDEFATWAKVWEFLLRESTRAKLPLLFSNGEGAVAAGALASLSPDYFDMGRQCGELAQQLTRGSLKINEVGVRAPAKVRWIINTRTASRIDLTIPAAVLDGAKIYR